MKKIHKIEEMGSSGHLGASWSTWALLTRSPLMQPSTDAGKNRAAKHSVNTARTQHQQKQGKYFESQHKEQQPHYIERKATGRDRLVHIPGQYNQQNGGTEEDVKGRIQNVRVAFTTFESKTNQN